MNIPGFLDLRNRENFVDWFWRWAAQGGCMHWRARDLQDRRNEEDKKRGRMIEVKVMQARREQVRTKKVVNLATQRALRKARG